MEVGGEGAHPGVYAFDHAPTLAEVWQKAGAHGAAPVSPAKLNSGDRLEIRVHGGYQVARMHGAELLTLCLPIDLNAAGAADLDALPGIGPALAQRIVDYRQSHGPFQKIDDLIKVSGIGPSKLEKIKPFLIITADERR